MTTQTARSRDLGRVLLVDDEPRVLAAYQRQLRNRFDVVTAEGAEAALNEHSRGETIAVVVSDLRMPSMDGLQLLAEFRTRSPNTIRLMLTGDADLSAAQAAVNQGQVFRFLTKPCEPPMLASAIDDALIQYSLERAEHELLANTLNGAVRLLAEMVSLADGQSQALVPAVRVHMSHLCDELGLDTISTGNLIAALIEGYEKDLLTIDDLDGKPISWGDADRVLELISQIAYCEGIGATLALGAKGVLARWPQLTPLVQHVKGLEQSAYDCRGAISMALAYGTSDIGAHHTRAWTVGKELEMGGEWDSEKKVDLVIYHQHIRSLFDMFGVCRLPWIELGFHEDFYAELYSAVTGKEYSLEYLLEKSQRI